MVLLLKAICQICAEIIAAAAQRNIFNDIANPNMKKLSTSMKSKLERRTSIMHLNYAVVRPDIIL